MPMPPYKNRLIREKSPYLLQHAHNPVDWFPWGKEAFEEAKAQDKPIFLSIGYAACHWCHVMEKESFENPEIAELMNEAFVNVKVDREELPAVDSAYMEFAQVLMSSSGGWPLNLILTPDLKPFFAVTYLPKESRQGRIGMREFIQHIDGLWRSEERGQLVHQADRIVAAFKESLSLLEQGELPTETFLEKSVDLLYPQIDPIHGGLKGEPKFPFGYPSLFFLERAQLHSASLERTEQQLLKHSDSSLSTEQEIKKEVIALNSAIVSLEGMQKGGLYDVLGGGFSRYAIDAQYRIPHFEKMLYDNAILAMAYLSGWKCTKRESFARTAQDTLGYLLREMSHPEGGFYAAQDADSEGKEGVYYTWTLLEIQQLLEPKDAEIFCAFYSVTPEGNFEGRNVLYASDSLEGFASLRSLDPDLLDSILLRARQRLFEQRRLRPPPFKDDKIVTAWNGLMIDVLARASSCFEDPVLLDRALKTAGFIRTHLFTEKGLLRRFREGEAKFAGVLDDYAFLIKGLLTLFEEGGGTEWLQWATELCAMVEEKFQSATGAFYDQENGPFVLLRRFEFYDAAEPSGNAVHCENLLRLYQFTQENSYLEKAEGILKAAKPSIEAYPAGSFYPLRALQRYLEGQGITIVVALDENRSLKKEIQKAFSSRFLPFSCIIYKEKEDQLLTELIPSLVDKNPVNGQTAIYICTKEHCEPPLQDFSVFVNRLGR